MIFYMGSLGLPERIIRTVRLGGYVHTKMNIPELKDGSDIQII